MDFLEKTGLSRKYERERPGFVSSITKIAGTGKKIDFTSGDYQYIADLADVQKLYQDSDPGKEFTITRPVIYNQYAANHLMSDSNHCKRISWLEKNIEGVIKALEAPEIIECRLRSRKDGYYSATHIVDLGANVSYDERFLAIAISLSKNKSQGYHQITTIHPKMWRDIFKADGTMRKKYIWAK